MKSKSQAGERAIVPFDPDASIFTRGLALAREIVTVPRRIRVVIVDDIEETTSNLAKLIGFEPDIEVVGVAFDGQAGIDITSAQQPDIVLMDICMPVMDGITATEIIVSDRGWKGAVIMMSVQGDQDYLRRAMLAGAKEYLVKPFSADEFVNSIRYVNHINALGGGPCTCSAQAMRSSSSAISAGGVSDPLLLETGDQVFDTARAQHGVVLGVFDPSAHAHEAWNREDAGFLWKINYTDGTEAAAWGLSLSPWDDGSSAASDTSCATCGHSWAEHFGNAGKRPCRVSWTSESEPTDCDDFVPGGPTDASAETTVIDLMAALRESVARAKERETRHAVLITYRTAEGEHEKEEICPACAAGEGALVHVARLAQDSTISDEDYEHAATVVEIHHPRAGVNSSAHMRDRGPVS